MKRKNHILLALISVMIMCSAFTGCNDRNAQEAVYSPDVKVEESAGTETEQQKPEESKGEDKKEESEFLAPSDEVVAESIADIEISTNYGSLYFPAEWEEKLLVTESSNDLSQVLTFVAMINEEQYILFDIEIGEGEGFEMGKITDKDGKQYTVYAYIPELSMYQGLSDEDMNTLEEMQEGLDYLVGKLK